MSNSAAFKKKKETVVKLAHGDSYVVPANFDPSPLLAGETHSNSLNSIDRSKRGNGRFIVIMDHNVWLYTPIIQINGCCDDGDGGGDDDDDDDKKKNKSNSNGNKTVFTAVPPTFTGGAVVSAEAGSLEAARAGELCTLLCAALEEQSTDTGFDFRRWVPLVTSSSLYVL